jgi:hypothetical protein
VRALRLTVDNYPFPIAQKRRFHRQSSRRANRCSCDAFPETGDHRDPFRRVARDERPRETPDARAREKTLGREASERPVRANGAKDTPAATTTPTSYDARARATKTPVRRHAR